jgi:hypothetical protein
LELRTLSKGIPVRRLTLFTLLFVCLTTATSALAQSNPTIQIVLSQSTAQQGDIVTADVLVRNVVNLGGADIGIGVDEKCLTIVDRQPGNLLPTTDAAGGFSAFSEQHEHDTRLAAAVINRSKIANGEGVFYRTKLKVICEKGVVDLKVTFAELSSYKDPTAKEVELNAYTMKAGTVTTVNAQLVIGASGQAVAQPTSVPANAPVSQSNNNDMRATLSALLIPLICVVVVVFTLIAFLLIRRRRNYQS